MPKQIHKIDQFHGGLNNNADPRDIAENELAAATDVMVDNLGKIRTVGSVGQHDSDASPSVTIEKGFGLFQFSHDRVGAETKGEAQDETGDDYLVLADGEGVVFIYSNKESTWGPSVLDIGSGLNSKLVYYSADGVVRLCDSNFNNSHNNRWYGYIERIMMESVGGNDVPLDGWSVNSGRISSPSGCIFDNNILMSGVVYQEQWSLTRTPDTGELEDSWFDTEENIYNGFNVGEDPTTVGKITFKVRYNPGGSSGGDQEDVLCDVKVQYGTATGSAAGDLGEWDNAFGPIETSFISLPEGNTGDSWITTPNSYSINLQYESDPDFVINSSDGTHGVKVSLSEIQTYGPVDYVELVDVKVYRGTGTSYAHSTLGVDKFVVEFDFQATDESSGWGDKIWNVGATFLYDGNQESLLVPLTGNEGQLTLLPIADEAPDINMVLKYNSDWNRRITGINIYMQEVDNLRTTSWYLQTSYDLVKGVGKAYPYGTDVDFYFLAGDGDLNEYHCFIYREFLKSPNLVDTYEAVSGFSINDKSVNARYKTAVVANRVAYVGNVKTLPQGSEGISKVYGDAIFKSMVNRFDTFPVSRKIEAVIADGDAIVKLEVYADRLLQFKKRVLHIINISQEIEFLEDTFVHKGVSNPSAVCKTDYGVAWVNTVGCYVYDGKQVRDLLEKGGRQIVSESDWKTLIDEDSKIAYIPFKRQLIVFGKHIIFIYDLVTQSWVKKKYVTNIIANPSFELAGGTPFLNWTELLESPAATWSQATDHEYAGSYSAKCVNHASQSGSPLIVSDAFTLTPGKAYTLTWYGRWNTALTSIPTITMRTTNAWMGGAGYLKTDGVNWQVSDVYPEWGQLGNASPNTVLNTWYKYTFPFRVPTGIIEREVTGFEYISGDNDTLTAFVADTSDIEVSQKVRFSESGGGEFQGGETIDDADHTVASVSDGSFTFDLSTGSIENLNIIIDTLNNSIENNNISPVVSSTWTSGDFYLTFYPGITSSNSMWIDNVSLSEVEDTSITNVVTDWNGDLTYVSQELLANGTNYTFVNKWDDTSSYTNNFSLKTKDFDFGQPGQRKKVYKVRISYKGDASELTTKFSVDGDTDALYQFNSSDSPLSNQTDLTKWHHAELTPTTASQSNNIYSLQLHFDGTAYYDFEINDISIVYRLKPVK